MKPIEKSVNKPKNPQLLRKLNRADILKRLATRGTASRIELSKELHLTKMAISTIVSEMLNENLVEECSPMNEGNGTSTAASGRKRKALEIPDYRINAIGVYILRYKIQGIAIDIKGNRLYSVSVSLPVGTGNAEFSALIIGVIERILVENAKTAFVGIGIASIGPLDIYRQRILNPPNFRDIKDFNIGEVVHERFRLPVFLDNDMNAGALAEFLYGIASENKDVVYLGIGSGVGSGIIINGQMLHGSEGYAGEFGHISVKMDGPLCSCGRRGCLELYTNTISLLEKTETGSIDELVDIISGDTVPERITRYLDEYKLAVLNAAVTASNMFDPEMVIIGDEGSKLIQPFLEQLETVMNQQIFQHGSHRIKLTTSFFGDSAPLIGAASLVFQKVFDTELVAK